MHDSTRASLACLIFFGCALTVRAADQVVIIAGKGGTAEFQQRFTGQVSQLYGALLDHQGFRPEQITILSEDWVNLPRQAVACDRESIQQAFAALATQAQASDRLFVILIGHGTDDGTWAKFNIPGRDLRDIDYAEMLNRLPCRYQIVINTAPASAAFIDKLSRTDRVIVTASRSATEVYTTAFPQFLAEALAQTEEVDLNKDGNVSVLELFDYVRDSVVRFYENANRLRPEHPLLDDNGDGNGSETPIATGALVDKSGKSQPHDGALAARLYFASSLAPAPTSASSETSTHDPLEQKKQQLLADIEALKAAKGDMPPAEYERQLEALFIQLAKTNRDLKNRR